MMLGTISVLELLLYVISFIYLPATVCPATKLEIAFLIIKRKPCNVYLAGALKDAWRDIETVALVGHHHVGLEGAIELLVGAAREKK